MYHRSHDRGVCLQEGLHSGGQIDRQTPPRPSTTGYGQQAGGTHPMGMHSCYYRPQRSWGKVMFLHVCVILFTGGVCLRACWNTNNHPPPGAVHAGRYGQQAGGTDPTGMRSCLNSCCYVLGVDDLYFNSVFTCNVSVITTAI